MRTFWKRIFCNWHIKHQFKIEQVWRGDAHLHFEQSLVWGLLVSLKQKIRGISQNSTITKFPLGRKSLKFHRILWNTFGMFVKYNLSSLEFFSTKIPATKFSKDYADRIFEWNLKLVQVCRHYNPLHLLNTVNPHLVNAFLKLESLVLTSVEVKQVLISDSLSIFNLQCKKKKIVQWFSRKSSPNMILLHCCPAYRIQNWSKH